MNINEVIEAADSLAHIAANVSGKLDMSPHQTYPELLYKQMQEWAKELVDAAGAYWKSKGSDEDGMPPENLQRKILDIEVPIYHPEDSTVNGHEDYRHQTPMMPYLVQVNPGLEWKWRISVDVETGEVVGWPIGVKASTNYKVCDQCNLRFGAVSYKGYVPDFLGIDDESWGDYICITIKDDGFIENWDKMRFYAWAREYLKSEGSPFVKGDFDISDMATESLKSIAKAHKASLGGTQTFK